MSSSTAKTAFLRQWGWTVAGAALFVAGVIGFRLWTDHRAEQPIAEPYRLFLEHLASISTEADSGLAQYRVKHQRTTVASKHFAALCAIMVRDARNEGAKPELFSVHMTRGCEQMGSDVTDLP